MIICAGEALVDLVPEPVPGGGPMNTAIACSRLGAPTAFLGRISTDAHGDMIWRHLQESGVDLTVAQRGDEPTCRAVVEGDPPTFHFYGEGTADRMIVDADLTPLGPGPHILHGGTLGMFRRPGAETYARVVERHSGLVSLDPNARPQIIGDRDRADWMDWLERWLPHTDLLRVSDDDLGWIWPGSTGEDVAALMLERGVSAVIITTSRGADVFTGSGRTSAPSRSVAVVDTVGAGDSFCGAVLTQLHEARVSTGSDLAAVDLAHWTRILEMAAHVASITVSRHGADPPWRSELT